MEQPEQEVAIKAVELVLPMFGFGFAQAIAEIIGVAIKEPFSLDEVEEHQPVQHDRRVPFVLTLVWNSSDELEKNFMLRTKLFVEALCNSFVDVTCRAPRYVS